MPVAGRAAVVRLIDTLRADGVEPVVVVVGHRAGDVVETGGAARPGVHFVYQRDQLGTGHAARLGIEALGRFGYRGPVLVTMGDKWFAPDLVRNARRRFEESGADLLVVSTPKRPGSSAGRLVHLPGRGIVGNVERRDIERARVLRDWLELTEGKETLTRRELRNIGLKRIRPAAKLWRALGPLARFSRRTGRVQTTELVQSIREIGTKIRVGGIALGPEQVERRSATVNESVYLGDTTVLEAALRRVGRANAQDEYYLTDVIAIVAGGAVSPRPDVAARVVEYRLRRADDVMAFNTRAEFERIEERVRWDEERSRGTTPADLRLRRISRPADEWLSILTASGRGRRLVERTYGMGGALVTERLRALRKAVRLFRRAYGRDRKLFLVRAPGRVNLMGRHIDHQGGFVHAMALDREIVMAVAPRNDDVIRLVNTDAVAFPPRELVLGDWRQSLRTPDWLSFVDGDAVRAHLMSTAGDWRNYILAAAVFQQHAHPHRRIRGMDVAVNGNVPMAAGLSSSSAMVVAAMEAVTAVNAIQAEPADIVSWCGQAEWFVGSRGGSSDQAAIRLGRAGHLARMGFFPFRLSRYVPIPADASVLIAFSGQHAVKSAGARDRFNERVANYRLGLLLLRNMYPRLASKLEYIRDVSTSRLDIKLDAVRAMVAGLPARITRREICHQLGPALRRQAERIFNSHSDPGHYTIRGVVAYGVGECERSRIAADHLDEGNLEAFGELMVVSHDGDRITGKPAPASVMGIASADMDSVPLHRIAGAYACSTENIDRLVDIARHVPGVYGAQLAGAGLGGCVMILAKRSAALRVKAALASEYYRPLGMVPAVWEVRSVAGGGIISP